MTTIESSPSGQPEAAKLAWMLLLNDLSVSAFSSLPMASQFDMAEAANISGDDLIEAMRFISAYHLQHAAQLESYAKNRRRPRH